MHLYKIKEWLYKKRSSLQFLFLLLLSLIMIFASREYYRKEFVGFTFYITSIFQRVADSSETTAEKWGGNLLSRKELIKKNRELEEKNNELNLTLVEFSTIENQLFLLKQKCKNEKIIKQKSIATELMAQSADPFGDSLIINRGSIAGVKKDAPVIAIQDNKISLVGKISTVTPYSASIRPLYHSQIQIGARLKELRYEGIVKGSGSSHNELKMFYVDEKAGNRIKVQDSVITSGLSSIYPPGIIIGKVIKMEEDLESPSLNLLIKPETDFSRLETLFVLIKDENREEIKE